MDAQACAWFQYAGRLARRPSNVRRRASGFAVGEIIAFIHNPTGRAHCFVKTAGNSNVKTEGTTWSLYTVVRRIQLTYPNLVTITSRLMMDAFANRWMMVHFTPTNKEFSLVK